MRFNGILSLVFDTLSRLLFVEFLIPIMRDTTRSPQRRRRWRNRSGVLLVLAVLALTIVCGKYLFSSLSVLTTTKVINKPGGREQELELASTTGGWQVLLQNDQFHTFDQVADIVHDMLGQVSRQDAFSAALKAHRYGESTLVTAPQRSVAERWVKMLTDSKITAIARPLFPDACTMDALLRTVDARVSVIDTQLALRDALDVLDRNGTNNPESYKVFGQLFETCRKGGPDLVTAILADTDVMSSMLRNIVPRLQDIQDSEALQDCLSFLGLLIVEVPTSDDSDDDQRRMGEKLRNRCAEKMLELSKDGSEIVRLITKQDSDMYLLYEEIRFIQSLHKRFPRIITSAVLEAPEVVASLVDLLKTCPAAFVRNECLSLVHNMVFGAADEVAGRGGDTAAAAEQMQIFPMLAFQGVIEALFGIVLEEPVVSAGDVPVVALETNLRLLGHEKTRRFWRTGGRESAEWAVEVFRHALYPNHHGQRQSSPDSPLFRDDDKGEEEELKGIPDVSTSNTVWPTLKLSMEILEAYWGSNTSKARTGQADKSEEKAYCIDLGIVDTITDQIDNCHLSDECRRDFLSIILSLLQSCGAITVEKLTSGSDPSLWKICSLMLQSPPPSISFRCSLSSFIEKATDLPPSVSTVLQNSLCVSFSARATAGQRDDISDDDDDDAEMSSTPGALVVSHLQGLSHDADDLLAQSAMYTNAWFSLQLVMNCIKGKNTQSQKMMASSALIRSSTSGYESLLTFIDKIFLNLANSLIETAHGDDDEDNDDTRIDENNTSVWSKDPSTLPTTVIAVLQALLVFRIGGSFDDAISTEPLYIKVLEGLFTYDRIGKMDINGLASLLLGSCLKASCANSDLATSIIESDIGIVPLYQAGATLLDTIPRPLGTIAKRPTWYPSFFIDIAKRAHQSAQRSLVEQTLRIRSSTKGNDEIAKLRSLLEVQQREVAKSKQEARDAVKVLADMSEQLSELRDTDTATLVKRIESLQKANTALTGEVDALKMDNENLSKSLVAERAAASRLVAETSYQMKALAGCYRDENLRVQKLMAHQRQASADNGGDNKPEVNGSTDRDDLVNLITALKKLCPSVLDILAAPIDEPISNGLPPGSGNGTISVINDDNSNTPTDEH